MNSHLVKKIQGTNIRINPHFIWMKTWIWTLLMNISPRSCNHEKNAETSSSSLWNQCKSWLRSACASADFGSLSEAQRSPKQTQQHSGFCGTFSSLCNSSFKTLKTLGSGISETQSPKPHSLVKLITGVLYVSHSLGRTAYSWNIATQYWCLSETPREERCNMCSIQGITIPNIVWWLLEDTEKSFKKSDYNVSACFWVIRITYMLHVGGAERRETKLQRRRVKLFVLAPSSACLCFYCFWKCC